MADFRYKAFISYSWADAASGNWLHHALETYRTPKPLIGKAARHGPVPPRLHPIFKDREEEAAGASIGGAIEAALGSSEFLIVICSPRSAQSRWVNHEIAWFKTHRDASKILALIVDGEPGDASAECFPKALTNHVTSAMEITDTVEDAPLAADVRDVGDGKKGARLKIVAAMLGVGLDELVRRDARRQAERTRIIVGTSLALTTVMSGLTVFAVRARNEAQHQHAQADGLVEYMLTDLRKKLEPVGRLDVLDSVGQKALAYYQGQTPGSLDADALGRQSRALHLVGEVRNTRGDSEGALVAFKQALATTTEQLARDPHNGQRIFDQAQSVYWVGYVAYQRGEIKQAEAAFNAYKRYADELVALDPKNGDWQMEVSYAQSNLGTLLFDQRRYAEAERAFTASLRVKEVLLAQKPNDTARQIDLGQTISWLANSRERLDRTTEAIVLYQREIALYQNVLRSDPVNTDAKRGSATAWSSIGELEMILSNQTMALGAYKNANTIHWQLIMLEPKNSVWREEDINTRSRYAYALFFVGQHIQSLMEHNATAQSLDRLIASDPKMITWNTDRRSILEQLDATLLAADSKFQPALHILQLTRQRLQDRTNTANPDFISDIGYVDLLTGDMQAQLSHKVEALASWQAAVAVAASDKGLSSYLLTIRFAALMRLGRVEEAQQVRAVLDARHYRYPMYVRERAGLRFWAVK